jgi:predicted transcriptional regulator
MATRSKAKQITIVDEGGTFSTLFKRFTGDKDEYDFNGLATLRNLLSNEKARILHVIKTKSPKSIYELSKILKRDFKSVSEDVKFLENFGFIDLISEKSGKRERLKPVIVVDSINIEVRI